MLSHPAPLTIPIGTVESEDSNGLPYTGDDDAFDGTVGPPSDQQIDYLHNFNEVITDARCAS